MEILIAVWGLFGAFNIFYLQKINNERFLNYNFQLKRDAVAYFLAFVGGPLSTFAIYVTK